MTAMWKRMIIFLMTGALMISMVFFVPLDVEAKSVKPFIRGSSTITEGKSAQFSVKYGKKKVSSRSCQWYSTKTSVATVGKNGRVYAKKAGTTYVYVKYQGKTSAKKKVTVKNSKIRPSVWGSSTITEGKNAQFSVKYGKKKVPSRSCQWYSTKTSVATVGKNGRVYAKKAGTTYVYVKYQGKTSAKKKVTVKNPPTCSKESDHQWVKQLGETHSYVTIVKPAKHYYICNSCGLLMENDEEVMLHFNGYSYYKYGPEIYRQDVDTITPYQCSNCGKTKTVKETEFGEERLAVFTIESWAEKKFNPEACAFVSCPRCQMDWSPLGWENYQGVCSWCQYQYPDWKNHIQHAWDQGFVYRNWDQNGREMIYHPDSKKWKYIEENQ
jgi:nicotinamide mononucleotide (NMN) deamidase PncC